VLQRIVLGVQCDGLHPVWSRQHQRAGGEHAVHGLPGWVLHGLRRLHRVQGVHPRVHFERQRIRGVLQLRGRQVRWNGRERGESFLLFWGDWIHSG
jgi:hypothetical protein